MRGTAVLVVRPHVNPSFSPISTRSRAPRGPKPQIPPQTSSRPSTFRHVRSESRRLRKSAAVVACMDFEGSTKKTRQKKRKEKKGEVKNMFSCCGYRYKPPRFVLPTEQAYRQAEIPHVHFQKPQTQHVSACIHCHNNGIGSQILLLQSRPALCLDQPPAFGDNTATI